MPHPHQSSEPPHDRKRLVMIMGVQRSGTTALFKALATAPGVTARDESPDNEIYREYFLRPEPEIRDVLAGLPGTVLLKPVRESELRSPKAVAAEYADYDLRIVWLYRDPVNVFDSYVRRGWTTADSVSARAFAEEWLRRNATAIADATTVGVRLVLIRYEDLVLDPPLVSQLAERLGIIVRTGFGADSACGRQRQPESVRLMIDGHTTDVRSQLDHLRAVRPAFEIAAQTDSRAAEAGCSITSTAEYRQIFQAPDPTSQHARWLAAGPPSRDADSDSFVSSGYAASRAVLGCSRPAQGVPSLRFGTIRDLTRTDLEHFFTVRRNTIAKRIGATANDFLASLPVGETCDLTSRLTSFSLACMATWLDVPESLAEAIEKEAQWLHLTAESREPSPGWEQTRDALMQRGLIADLCVAGLLEGDDVIGFVCDTAMRLLAVPAIVCNAFVAIAGRPESLSVAREHPAMIPGIFAEAMRLVPMWFSLRRRMSESLRLADIVIPEDATVDVFVTKANRDPAAFEAPDDLRPDRCGPAPILTDTDTAPYTGLADNPPWGCRHVLFDVSVLAIERLLAGPLTMAFQTPVLLDVLPMPNGDQLQTVPRELLVTLQPRTPRRSIGRMFSHGRASGGRS